MTAFQKSFGVLQKIGKALMLPVSVLPVAGILLGVGAAHFAWLPPTVSSVMEQAGGAIFGSLPLIFAIGVALGFTQNDGVGERALLPFGLHHIWNVPFFFEVGSYTDASGTVIKGELHRFMAGDPTAGNLAGGYLFKMWGLPAAALAIWRTAKPENRAKV